MINKLAKIIAFSAAFFVIFGVFAGCDSEKTNTEAYISLSINPEIELTVDSKNIITSVNCANEDAEMLLSDVSLEGLSLESGAEKFVALAKDAGYIDVGSQDNQVTATVIGEDEAETEKLHKSLADRINKYFENNGIYGKVSKETLAQYAEQAASLGVSTGKAKMILRALDMYPEKTVEELSELSTNQLVKLFKDKVKDENLGQIFHEKFKAEKERLKLKYENLFTLKYEIESLKASLETFNGTEEEKADLLAQIEQKQNEIDQLKQQYEQELEVLHEELKTQRQAFKEKLKAEKQQKITSIKEKIDSHKNEFEKNKKNIIEKIKNWRNQQNAK